MSTKLKVAGLVLAGLVILTAGCGGAQNPAKIDTASSSPFFNGLWDGFTVLVVFVKDITSSRDYQYYTHNAIDIYYVGYLVGIMVLVAVLGWLANFIRGYR